MTEGLLTDYAAAAGQFTPVDPAAVHPVVDRRPADPGDRNAKANWQKLRFLLAMFTEKMS